MTQVIRFHCTNNRTSLIKTSCIFVLSGTKIRMITTQKYHDQVASSCKNAW